MRGRRAQPSSPQVGQQQNRMALREQIMKDISDVPSDSQQSKDCTQENGAPDDRDSDTELSSSLLPPLSLRERRKRERENKPKPKEMTEEEMMDLALHLSKQEASITAIRQQQEEEAMRKAIQESMVSQTQPCVSLESQSFLTGAGASPRLCSRRKLLYLNREQVSEDSCLSETDLNGESQATKDESQSRSKKRKRRERSPLLEMPDLSQTQKISTQDSQSSLEPLELQLDSPQSCDLTQIEDCKSPVFPSTSCRAEVQVHSLNPNPVDSCKTSGLVAFSQDSSDVTQKSPSSQPKSPTFPKSQRNCQELPLTRSPMFSKAEQGEDSDTQLSQDEFKSPVFGRTTQQNKALDTSRPQICNSGLTSSSQESLFSSVRAASCHPQSPVFPGSPAFHETENARLSQSSETDELTDQNKICCPSPVFDRIENHSKISLSGLRHTEGPADINESSQSLKKCSKTNHNPDVTFKSDEAEDELTEIHKDCNTAEMELSSDMKLLWSDDDENDVMPAGSPSPVFPDEKTVQRTDSQAAPLFHVTAASPNTNGTNFSQQVTSERDLQNVNSQETASSLSHPPQESAGGATVQYYWGVPFCPRGMDPDSYTQVILAQMDVYEKSLKTAQRFLLRKAEWGEAVLPQEEKPPSRESQSPESSDLDIPRRGGLRLRGKRLSEEDDNSPAIESKEGEEKMDGGEEQEKKQKEAEKKNEGGEEVYSDDCEVCPETQLSNNDEDDDQTQDLLLAPDPGEDLHSESPEQLDVDMLLRDDSPAAEDQPQDEEMELETEAPVDVIMKETSATEDVERENEDKDKPEEEHGDTCVEEMNGHRLQRSMSPELEPAVVPQRPETSVDCPICQGAFPTSEIEMHAAYCDGEVAVVHEKRPKPDLFQVSLKPRRKRIRRLVSREEEEAIEPSNSGKNQEKCYVCQRAVPLREYSRHTELCIQRQGAKTSGKGNLLSALEQTDSRDSEAGPSGSKHQTGEVIELLDDDEEDEESSTATALRISNSPIRAFTPISEATDCLIDFKKQRRVKKTSQRRR